MHQSKALQFIYTIFIGILVATFIGLGIDAFYGQPKYPEYPKYSTDKPGYISDPNKPYIETEEDKASRVKYESDLEHYNKNIKVYNQNVSIVTLVFSIVILIVSLTLMKNLLLISDGLLLGGVLTLLYSIIRGFMTDSSKFRFSLVAVGLIAAITVGYIKFVKPLNQ